MADHKKSILIIDDEAGFLDVISSALSHRGYQTWTAKNGEEGLKAMTHHTPDLVILDVGMPRMGGIEFYEEALRHYERKIPFAILVLTGRTDLVALFKTFHVDGFMSKPFNLVELLREVETIFRERERKANEEKAGPKSANVVLIVENDSTRYEAIKKQFNEKGIKTRSADSGVSGIERAKEIAPDLILIKLNLPDVAGDMVAFRLKKFAATQNIPIILYCPKFEGSDRSVLYGIMRNLGIHNLVESDEPYELLEEAIKVVGPK